MLHVLSSPLQWVLYVLAVYGLFALVFRVARLLYKLSRSKAPPKPASILVLVRNQEHQIEGVLRSLGNMLRSHRSAVHCDLVVVDHCSSDETAKIIERLSHDLHGLRMVQIGEQVCRGQAACEIGLFACQSRVVLVLDLMGAGEARTILQTVAGLLGTQPSWWT